jgi:hypothetical protein
MGRVGIRKKKEKYGRRGSAELSNINFFDGFTTDGNSIGDYVSDSDGNIDTSPYGSAISNPSVSPSAI